MAALSMALIRMPSWQIFPFDLDQITSPETLDVSLRSGMLTFRSTSVPGLKLRSTSMTTRSPSREISPSVAASFPASSSFPSIRINSTGTRHSNLRYFLFSSSMAVLI